MRLNLKHLVIGIAASVMFTGTASAEKVIIGQFGIPSPMELVVMSNALQKATGWDVEWRKFASGTDVIAAMASGDLVLAQLGSSPLAIAASQGVGLQLIAFADVIGEAESLIAHNGSGIKSVADLKGKRIAVPIGSTAHFSLMGALKHAGIAEKDVTIINMKPDQIAASWNQGVIDAAWIWQPVQSEILKTGKLIIGAGQTAAWGYPTFDGWVVNTKFGAANKDKIVAFLKIIDKANASYLKDPAAWTVDSAQAKIIAKATGADLASIPTALKGFDYIPMSKQVSATWLGGAAKTLKNTSEFLKAAGRIATVAKDYAPFVNSSYAEAASK